MRAALLLFFCACSSIANGLRDCLDIDSFTLPHDKQGQCQPSKHPGAFYTEEYDKWECWDEDLAKGGDVEAVAKAKGFSGACTFAAYKSTTTPEDVPLCSHLLDHNPLDCHPGPERYWGACVTNISERSMCIPRDDKEFVAGVAKGDCKSFSIRDDVSFNPSKYNDVCRFEFDKPFKCPTVPTYVAEDKRTCSSRSEEGEELHPFGSACFSLVERTGWSCRAEAAEEASPCTWTYVKGVSAFMKRLVLGGRYYDGSCLFPGSPGYDMAIDWASQDPDARSQRPLASPKDQGGSISRVLMLVPSFLILAGAGVIVLFCQRARSAREQPLVGDAATGAEMSAPRDGAAKSRPFGWPRDYIAD